jgi:hypothetical protein
MTEVARSKMTLDVDELPVEAEQVAYLNRRGPTSDPHRFTVQKYQSARFPSRAAIVFVLMGDRGGARQHYV